jgi:hypothetical protein
VRRFHIAIGVADVGAAAPDDSARLGCPPAVLVPGEYALWRTASLNFSIRRAFGDEAGRLRHLGWEDPDCGGFATSIDCSGIVREHFSADQQAAEIAEAWPGADYRPVDRALPGWYPLQAGGP